MSTDAPPTELPKTYDPAAVEGAVRAKLDAAGLYRAEPTAPGEPYSVVIPPPNVTAALHLGHALNNTLQDILVRRARMQGKNAIWLPGTDHAGIATQTVVDKRLQAQGDKALKDYKRQEAEQGGGREAFIAKVQAWKDEYEARITDQLKAMGSSCDWDRQAFTMDEPRAAAVREAFFQLFKDGLITRGKRLVNWDPITQTALADDEVEMQDVDGQFYYMKYPVVKPAVPDAATGSPDQWTETGEFVTVATTRPETMLGDTAVAVNPKDEPRAKYIGQHVKLPIAGRIIPIVGDDYVVIPDAESSDSKARMASGFLKVTPAHDPNDYEIGQRHDLPTLNVMAPDASISKDHGWPAEENPEGNADLEPFLGLSREDARKQIVRWFKEHDLLADQKPYRHAVGHSYRSHQPIEPYLSDQWYVNVTKPTARLGDDNAPVPGTTVPKNSLAGCALLAMDPAQRSGDFGAASPQSPEREQGGANPTADVWTITLPESDALSRALHAYAPFVTIDTAKRDDGASTITATIHADAPPLEALEIRELLETNGFTAMTSPQTPERERGGATTGLTFHPDRYAKNFQLWHENLRDWCISRQLWWGHRIPVWRVRKTKMLDDPKTKPRDSANLIFQRLSQLTDEENEFIEIQEFADYENQTGHVLVCVKPGGHNIEAKLEEFGAIQDPDVLDTWFSSALWPLSTLGWPEETPELNTWNPTSVLCTAREIITLWVSRMVMFNLYFTSPPQNPERQRGVALTQPVANPLDSDPPAAPRLPFHDVFIHAMIQDGHGQKMSKSLGNGVDPMDIIHSHGADAMRFTLASMTTQTQDVRMPVDVVDPRTGDTFTPKFTTASGGYKVAAPTQEYPPGSGKQMVTSFGLASGRATPTDDMPLARNTSEKFDLGQRFANKLWNATRFALGGLTQSPERQQEVDSQDASPQSPERQQEVDSQDSSPQSPERQRGVALPERWILSRLRATVAACDTAIEAYRFADYATAVYDFIWRDLCDWYIEAVKPKVEADPSTRAVLAACLDASLRLLHPAMPLITERLWEALNEAVPGDRSLPGLALPPNPWLTTAAWPQSDHTLDDNEGETGFEALRGVVSAVREIKASYKLPTRQLVQASVKAPADVAALLQAERVTLNTLAAAEFVALGPETQKPSDAAASTLSDLGQGANVELYVHGLVDSEAEQARLTKRLEELTKNIASLEKRLSNKGYIDKAPAKLVDETRSQLAQAQQKAKSVQQQLDALGT